VILIILVSASTSSIIGRLFQAVGGFILSQKNDQKLEELSQEHFIKPIELLVEKCKDTLIPPPKDLHELLTPDRKVLAATADLTKNDPPTNLAQLAREHFDEPFKKLIATFPDALRPNTILSNNQADKILANLSVPVSINIPEEKLEGLREIERSIQVVQKELIRLKVLGAALLTPHGTDSASPQLKIRLEEYLKKVPAVQKLLASVRSSLVQSVGGSPHGSLLEDSLNLSELAVDWKSDFAAKVTSDMLHKQVLQTKLVLLEVLKSLSELQTFYRNERGNSQTNKLDPESLKKIEELCRMRMKAISDLRASIQSSTGQCGLLPTLNSILEYYLPSGRSTARESTTDDQP
jgi:hypothetical protein